MLEKISACVLDYLPNVKPKPVDFDLLVREYDKVLFQMLVLCCFCS